MDVFDRFGNLLRSFLDDIDASNEKQYQDPDLGAAWEELNAFLEGEEREEQQQNFGSRPRSPSDNLRRDFRNLEVPFGASIERVRQSYKRLLAQYHPDKHAGNAERQRTATEITKKLNDSYRRIRDFYGGIGASS